MIQIINIKRSSLKEIEQAISDNSARDFEVVSDIVQIANGQIVDPNDDYLYSSFIVGMQREWEKQKTFIQGEL